MCWVATSTVSTSHNTLPVRPGVRSHRRHGKTSREVVPVSRRDDSTVPGIYSDTFINPFHHCEGRIEHPAANTSTPTASHSSAPPADRGVKRPTKKHVQGPRSTVTWHTQSVTNGDATYLIARNPTRPCTKRSKNKKVHEKASNSNDGGIDGYGKRARIESEMPRHSNF